MPIISNDIENRPEELRGLPHYSCLPERAFEIDLKGAIGEFLANDIFDLDGIQPIENTIVGLSKKLFNSLPVIGVNPSEEATKFYEVRGDQFQMVNIVICCYGFEEVDGQLYGLPYHISLRPAQKRGQPSSIGVEWFNNINLEKILEGSPRYMGFNPFTNAFGFYTSGDVHLNGAICSDVIGFVSNTYFLANKYDKNDVAYPGICTNLLGENRSAWSDYRKFRFSRYFKPFTNITPVKIWGCDSPIELFLLQAMNSLHLRPKIQMIIFSDGTLFPSLQSMWENGKRTKTLSKMISEADFYFEEQRVAIFCDSVAHHSSSEAIAKDNVIDQKLEEIGIRSIRISGSDIVASPLECARRIRNFIRI
ncbi:hypothetical protein [Psychrobacter sp. 16-MNA-CIBAN-0192]|uniref:endonuclease domain-containing protein n=1 Tax=Psychrobacter sp. 16-MNA-CIBAN-0192 TaxID=3140448 RepID=UPI00331A3379